MALFEHAAQPAGIVVASFGGVPVYLTRSLVGGALAFVALVAVIAPAGDAQRVACLAAVHAGVIVLSVLLHEIGHVRAAQAVGIAPERIDLGFPASAAVLTAAPRSAAQAGRIAAAGPAVTALLVLAGVVLTGWVPGGDVGGLQYTLNTGSFFGVFAVLLLLTNLELLVFNLLPGLPLDGGRLLWAWLWHIFGDSTKAFIWAAWMGAAVGAVVAAAGLALLLGHHLLGGIVLALAGAWQWRSAVPSRGLALVLARLDDATVADALSSVQPTLYADTPSDEALARFESLSGIEHLPVVARDGRYVGIVRRRALAEHFAVVVEVAKLTPSPATEDSVQIVRPDDRVGQYLVAGALAANGALVVVDVDERFRGVVYSASLWRAVAPAAP